ncbi:MAG TPA: hypothetical protein VK675_01115 [Candidatus Paceibacterota bacterium]|nr:hypothetical protein [Candidatus Paceibacterota bacterium]
MNKIVPLISSRVAGPLGVRHLPRFWSMVSLEALRRLAPGYSSVSLGLDEILLDGLGLKREALIDSIEAKRPTYTQFEELIRKQPEIKLDASSIAQINGAIVNYKHEDAIRTSILNTCGLSNETCSLREAVGLDQLRDWHAFHTLLKSERAAKFVPLISSGVAGPLGILHLPRLWSKVLLDARGQLATGYSSVGSGLDEILLDRLGLKKEAVIAYIHEKRPTYIQFEEWVRNHPDTALHLDSIAIWQLNAEIAEHRHPYATRMLIFSRCGLTEGTCSTKTEGTCSTKDAISLDNLENWQAFYEYVVSLDTAKIIRT